MTSNHEHPSTKAQDEELARQVAESLDSSLGNLDEYTLARLAKARRAALASSLHRRQWMGGVAIAASLAALIVIPIAGRMGQPSIDVDSFEASMSYLQEDPQMFLDMEMLLAIGETGSES